MRKTMLLSIAMLVAALSYAQEPYKAYCALSTSGKILQRGDIEVFIDFGQQINWNPAAYLADPETGKDIKFNSMVNALNYMSKRGWQLENINDDNVFFMSKLVTDDSQITEGITTRGMYDEKKKANRNSRQVTE